MRKTEGGGHSRTGGGRGAPHRLLRSLREAGLWKASGGVLGAAVLLGILIAVNVIVGSFRLRRDMTEERLYTLSEGTRRILSGLDRDVTLKFFFSGSSPETPVQLKDFAQDVEDLLREYALSAGGRIILEKYDPEPDSDAEEWAQRYGLSGQSLGLVGPTLYLGLVAEVGGESAAIPALNPRNSELLEYQITRLIYRLSRPEKPVVGVMSALPVMGFTPPPFPMPGQPRPQPQPPWVPFQELGEDYEVREVAVSATEIDEDLDALIVVHPKDLSEATLYALDQFVLRGGRLLAFLDPLCIVDEGQAPGASPFSMGGKASDLGRLLPAWGVSFDNTRVLADLDAASRVRSRDGSVEESPVWLSLRRENVDPEDVVTTGLESLMLPFAGTFEADTREGLTVSPLVMSSEDAGLVSAMMAQFGSESVRREFKSGMKKLSVALRLHGTLSTAFPEGKPRPADDDSDTPGEEGEDEPATAPEPAEPGLTQSQGPSTVILVGDADMLNNDFCVQEISFFGATAYQPFNDNLAFFANLVEQAAGSSDLIGVRSRGVSARPFEKVLALERNAQQRWLLRERELQEKLQQTQSRLRELQSQKDQSQQYILSREQKEEIDRFRQEERRVSRELKLVRRNLREDIEVLGVKVKVLNILLMPLLVSIAGIVFGLHRSSRSGAKTSAS